MSKIRIDSTSLSFFIEGMTYYITIPSKHITSDRVETLEKITMLLHSMGVESITTRKVK